MAAGYVLSADDVGTLRQLIRWWRSQGGGVASSRRSQILPPPLSLIGKVDDNPWTTGTATVSVWEWNGSAWADSTVNQTVYMWPWVASWSIPASTWVRLDWHSQFGAYYATPMISQTMLTDWQYNASSADIEEKTRTIVGPFTGAESGWTKVDDTEECA